MLLRRIDGVLRIRDSKLLMFQAPRDAVADVLRLLPDAEPPTSYPMDGDNMLAMQAPVSYTHLDVYKRQRWLRWTIQSRSLPSCKTCARPLNSRHCAIAGRWCR